MQDRSDPSVGAPGGGVRVLRIAAEAGATVVTMSATTTEPKIDLRMRRLYVLTRRRRAQPSDRTNNALEFQSLPSISGPLNRGRRRPDDPVRRLRSAAGEAHGTQNAGALAEVEGSVRQCEPSNDARVQPAARVARWRRAPSARRVSVRAHQVALRQEVPPVKVGVAGDGVVEPPVRRIRRTSPWRSTAASSCLGTAASPTRAHGG